MGTHPIFESDFDCLTDYYMPFKVKIKEWRTVASWHWQTGDEAHCGICRNYFDAICAIGDCNRSGDSCPIIAGECSHMFHYHCIQKWLTQPNSEDLCPLCRSKWQYKDHPYYKKICGISTEPTTRLPIPQFDTQ